MSAQQRRQLVEELNARARNEKSAAEVLERCLRGLEAGGLPQSFDRVEWHRGRENAFREAVLLVVAAGDL